jgi:hypothetical protein
MIQIYTEKKIWREINDTRIQEWNQLKIKRRLVCVYRRVANTDKWDDEKLNS